MKTCYALEYLHSRFRFDEKKKAYTSSLWLDISSVKDDLFNGSQWLFENGSQTNCWVENWLGKPLFSRKNVENIKCSVAFLMLSRIGLRISLRLF